MLFIIGCFSYSFYSLTLSRTFYTGKKKLRKTKMLSDDFQSEKYKNSSVYTCPEKGRLFSMRYSLENLSATVLRNTLQLDSVRTKDAAVGPGAHLSRKTSTYKVPSWETHASVPLNWRHYWAKQERVYTVTVGDSGLLVLWAELQKNSCSEPTWLDDVWVVWI